MASTYLKKTNSGVGSTTKATFSAWMKRCGLSTNYFFMEAEGDNDYVRAAFASTGEFILRGYNSGSQIYDFKTTAKFTDTSSWYHIVFGIDTTQATASDRVKIYVNGEQMTSFSASTYPSQNINLKLNKNGEKVTLGAYRDDSSISDYYDGLMSHVNYIDGTQYAASAFGSTDATTGEWVATTSPSVTYGTNGFFILKDSNSVTDQSGNSNNFTVGAGTFTNTEDCTSNNFSTLNANAITHASNTLAYGNTEQYCSTNWLGAISTLGASAGKFYAEAKITDKDNFAMGICQSNGDTFKNMNTANNGYCGKYNDGWGWNGNGSAANKVHNGTETSYGSAFANNDIFMIAFDITNGSVFFGKNGTWFDSSNPSNNTSPAYGSITFTNSVHFMSGSETGRIQWNFGNGYFGSTAISSEGTNASEIGKFEYDVPSGFTALSTKGLNE